MFSDKKALPKVRGTIDKEHIALFQIEYAGVKPWGRSYRTVMKRLRRSPQVTCSRLLNETVPYHQRSKRHMAVRLNEYVIPLITEEKPRKVYGMYDREQQGLKFR